MANVGKYTINTWILWELLRVFRTHFEKGCNKHINLKRVQWMSTAFNLDLSHWFDFLQGSFVVCSGLATEVTKNRGQHYDMGYQRMHCFHSIKSLKSTTWYEWFPLSTMGNIVTPGKIQTALLFTITQRHPHMIGPKTGNNYNSRSNARLKIGIR